MFKGILELVFVAGTWLVREAAVDCHGNEKMEFEEELI